MWRFETRVMTKHTFVRLRQDIHENSVSRQDTSRTKYANLRQAYTLASPAVEHWGACPFQLFKFSRHSRAAQALTLESVCLDGKNILSFVTVYCMNFIIFPQFRALPRTKSRRRYRTQAYMNYMCVCRGTGGITVKLASKFVKKQFTKC